MIIDIQTILLSVSLKKISIARALINYLVNHIMLKKLFSTQVVNTNKFNSVQMYIDKLTQNAGFSVKVNFITCVFVQGSVKYFLYTNSHKLAVPR